MPDDLRQRLAAWLRKWADHIDDDGAPKRTTISFTFERCEGLRARQDGKGCPLYYIRKSDYERAHDQADSNQPDPLMEDAKRFLDAADSGKPLPEGWTLGGTAGREAEGRG